MDELLMEICCESHETEFIWGFRIPGDWRCDGGICKGNGRNGRWASFAAEAPRIWAEKKERNTEDEKSGCFYWMVPSDFVKIAIAH